MKTFIFILTLSIIASCGENSRGSKNDQREVADNGSCQERKSALCEQSINYLIASQKAFPMKMKVFLKIEEDYMLEIYNDCAEYVGSAEVNRQANSGTISFQNSPEFLKGSTIEIYDAGDYCDNNAIFFDQHLVPEVKKIPGQHDLGIFILNN